MSSTSFKRWFLLLVALVLVAVACGGSDDTGVEDAEFARFDNDAPAGGNGGAFAGGEQLTETTSAPASEIEQEQAAGDDSAIGSGGIEPVVQPTDLGREIVRQLCRWSRSRLSMPTSVR